jgi:hypothetical protein
LAGAVNRYPLSIVNYPLPFQNRYDEFVQMIKLLPVMGFTALFLMISPQLREVAIDGIAWGVDHIVKYSPWSYIGAVTGLLLFAVISNYRSPTT